MTATDELRLVTLDEALAKAKADDDVQLAEWLRQARGAYAAARWYTKKLRDLEDENARLRSCLSDDADNARQIMGENAKLRELVRHMHTCLEHYEPGDTISCEQCPYDNETWGCDYERLMAELGIEVDA